MNNCDEIKNTIDQLPTASDAQKASIVAHLTSCNECTEYKAVADQNTKFFHSMNFSAANIPAIDKAYTSIEIQTRALQRQTLFALAGLFTSLFSIIWFLANNNLEYPIFIISSMIFISFSFVFVVRNTSQKAHKYLHLKESDDFINSWKKELKDNIRETSITGPVIAVFAYVLPIGVFFQNDMLINYKLMSFICVVFIVTIFVLYRFLIILPQLKKELSLLESGDL